MYVAKNLDGLNIGKALGRALGGAGRAALSVIPGIGAPVAAALDVAARQPAGAKDTVAVAAAPALVAAAQAAPVPTAQPTATMSDNDKLMQAALLKFVTAQPVVAAAPQATMQPSNPSVVISSPAPSYASAPAASSLPSWAIPAMIGGALLLFMQSKK